MKALAQILSNVPDPDKEPDAFRKWMEARSVKVRCPHCGNTWERIGGKAGEVEICPECWDEGYRGHAWTPNRSPWVVSREEQLEAAGVPYRFREPFQARRWPLAESGERSEEWAGSPCFIGFIGDSGSGKTAMASELFWRRLREKGAGIWTRADLLVQGLFRNDDRSEEAYATPLLLIDDLGWGVLGQSIEKLFGVIVSRFDDRLETIWTSNHPLSHFAKSAAGEPLARRLRDDGLLVPVKGKWKDHLERAAEKRSGRVLGEAEE